MPQFEILMNTPEALANFSPGFELARTLGPSHQKRSNPEESVGLFSSACAAATIVRAMDSFFAQGCFVSKLP